MTEARFRLPTITKLVGTTLCWMRVLRWRRFHPEKTSKNSPELP